MTVIELMAVLKTLPESMEVIVQKDPEGNGFSSLGVTYLSHYEPADFGEVKVGYTKEELTPDLVAELTGGLDFPLDSITVNGPQALILAPSA